MSINLLLREFNQQYERRLEKTLQDSFLDFEIRISFFRFDD